MILLQVQLADPTLWEKHGIPIMVILCLFSIIMVAGKWALNHYTTESRAWRSTVEDQSRQWRETVTDLEKTHREERKEWKEAHARAWDEMKESNERERDEWKDTLVSLSGSTQALQQAIHELPSHLDKKVRAVVSEKMSERVP